MSNQGGYAIVDVDEELGGDIGGQGKSAPSGLEFQTFLDANTPSDPALARGSSPYRDAAAPSSGARAPYSIWNLTYYQHYFDVTTATVRGRCLAACLPREGFINDVCEERVDLYGPFWTLTTLILAIFLSSSLSSSLTAYLSNPLTPIRTDLTLLSAALSTVYAYGLLFPALLWGATQYLARREAMDSGGGAGGVGEWSVAEAVALWGYAMGVFVPVSILCVMPIPIMRWILVGGAAVSSGYFLVKNVYPVLAGSSDNKLPRLLIIVVVVMHAAIALTMKVMFFSYAVAGKTIGPGTPLEGGSGSGVSEEVARRWWM